MEGLGAVLILAATGIIGFAMAGNVQRQKRILRDLHGILIRFRAEIRCSRPPLVNLCRLVAKSTHGAVKQSFYLLADDLERDKDVLNAFEAEYGIVVEKEGGKDMTRSVHYTPDVKAASQSRQEIK